MVATHISKSLLSSSRQESHYSQWTINGNVNDRMCTFYCNKLIGCSVHIIIMKTNYLKLVSIHTCKYHLLIVHLILMTLKLHIAMRK